MPSAESRKRRSPARLVGAGLTVVATAVAADAAAFEIAPHRALYSLDLISTSNAAAVADVDGEMMFQWADSCDGWTVEQRYDMVFTDGEGAGVQQSSVYATWESKDGKEFTFTLRSTTNGAVDKEVRGAAHLEGEGAGGSATFRLPEEVSQKLPPGTIFPTAHTLRMLSMAETPGGPAYFNAALFDGTGLDSLREINAVIGEARPVPGTADFPLLDRPSWPVGLAFYPEDERLMLPEYEMSVDLHDNGVVSDMVIDYGTFAVRATLDRLEPVDDDC